MKRFFLAGAAFVALTGFAAAQTAPDIAPPPPAQSDSPSIVIPPPPPVDAEDTEAESEAMGQRPMMDRMRGEGGDRRDAKDQGRRPGSKWRHGDMSADMDRDMGRGMRNMARHMGHQGRAHGAGGFHDGRGQRGAGEDGARFTFERPGKGKVDIRCASEDSTQECVDAVLPMLRDLMPDSSGDNRSQ